MPGPLRVRVPESATSLRETKTPGEKISPEPIEAGRVPVEARATARSLDLACLNRMSLEEMKTVSRVLFLVQGSSKESLSISLV